MPDAVAPLAGIVRLSEFEPLARAAMDPAAFDYVASGTWDEITLAENEAAWLRRRFRPRVLVDVSRVDPSTTLLGSRAAFPLATAPMATHGLAHRGRGACDRPRGGGCRGAVHAVDDVVAVDRGGRGRDTGWHALVPALRPAGSWSRPDRSSSEPPRPATAAIVLTVDLAVVGYRERDLRSGFELPALGNFGAVRPSHRDRLRGDEDMQELSRFVVGRPGDDPELVRRSHSSSRGS